MKIKNYQSAQILVTTLVVLLLVSLTVVVITATIRRNNLQVYSNLQYERNYNYAEARVIEAVEVISKPDFELATLTTGPGIGQSDCIARGMGEYMCTFSEPGTTNRTVLKIFETNIVEDFSLIDGDYFDIKLVNVGNSSYNGNIQLKWSGVSAFDLNLIFVDSQQKYRSVHQIIDPTVNTANEVYDSASASGFLNYNPLISPNEISINLGQLDTNKIPSGSNIKKIRVKAVTRQSGTSITIRPITNQNNLPNQVRRIEAFSYSLDSVDTSAPVLLTQLPLEPVLPDPMTYVQNLQSIKSPICGDNIVEGREDCDDGNAIDGDSCPNTCKKTVLYYLLGGYSGWTSINLNNIRDRMQQMGCTTNVDVKGIVGSGIPGGTEENLSPTLIANYDHIIFHNGSNQPSGYLNSNAATVVQSLQTQVSSGGHLLYIVDGCEVGYCQNANLVAPGFAGIGGWFGGGVYSVNPFAIAKPNPLASSSFNNIHNGPSAAQCIAISANGLCYSSFNTYGSGSVASVHEWAGLNTTIIDNWLQYSGICQ